MGNFAFSVIIPLYNKQNHIKRAIRSVLAQTYQSFEIIIVDDGSTDKSLETASAIRDPRIRIFHQENRGVSAARNFGVEKAVNEWVAFLDADDSWENTFLEEILCLMKEYPDSGLYASTSKSHYSDNHSIIQVLPYPIGNHTIIDDIFFSLRVAYPFNSSCVVVNRTILQKVGGFPENVKAGEDTITWIKIGLISQIAFVNLPLVTYYLDAENRASNNLIPPDIPAPAVFISELFSKNAIPKRYVNSAMEYAAKLLISSAKIKVRENKPLEAIKLLWKCKNTKLQKGIWFRCTLRIHS